MITDKKFFAESLLIPHSYTKIFKKIHSNLGQPNYPVLCNTYREKLGNSFQNDAPKIKEFSNYTPADFLRNVIFLKQAQNFGKLAKDSLPEVKPLLLYYAENQLFAFFINSIFHFDGSSKGHGLSMNGDSYENIGIEFQKSGFFQRIVNSYTILGAPWVFSPFRKTSSGGFESSDNEFSINNQPVLSLKRLIELKNHVKPDPYGYVFDQTDFLFLFLASSLARYKPDIWHSIVNGENRDEIAYFKQTFSRYEKLWDRLLDILYSMYHGELPSPLYDMDVGRTTLNYKID